MVNRTNYLLVKDHLRYLKDILQLSPDTINRYWFYLRHLLLWADKILLSNAQSIKPTFPVYLSTLAGRSIDKPMAFTSQKKIIQVTKRFFTWAKSEGQTGYQSLPVSWIGALHPVRQTVTSTEHEYVSVEEVIHLATLPVEEKNLALRRDQAAVAMLFLSGARATAFTTLSIEAVDIPESTIYQWPELGVETKNSKRCTTYLLQIPELLDIVQKWDAYIRSRLPSSALWYTPINNQWGEQELSNNEPGKNRNQTLSKRLRCYLTKLD